MAALRSCSGHMSALEVESQRGQAGTARMRHFSDFALTRPVTEDAELIGQDL